jgi:hypothetical protein
MKRVLLAVWMAIALGAPAFAQSTGTSEKATNRDLYPDKEQSGSTVSTTVVAPHAPPPTAAIEAPPASPGPTAVWTPGYWRWDPEQQSYTWVSGQYAEPPHALTAWVPGHWQQEPRGWIWVEGHWN